MNEKINFSWPVTSENAVVLKFFLSKILDIKEALQDKRIVIFGSGIRGCCLQVILQKQGFSNFVFCDNNPKKQGNCIDSYDILSFDDALAFDMEQVFLLSPEDSGKMSEQLMNAGLKEGVDWFSFSVSAYDSYTKEYIRPISDHLLVMGDCAFTHVALSDKNMDALGTMIKGGAGADRCKVLDMHGMGQQAYYHIARSLIDSSERPSVFLLLLMIETMAPKVPIMPRTQHPTLIKSLVRVAKNPNQAFIDYADLAQERFDRFQVEAFTAFDSTAGQQSEKLYMEINYLYKFRETTEGVEYLKKTIRMMNDENIPVVLYVPPVNCAQGEHLFGVDFKSRYEVNFKKLYDVLDKEELQYEVVDASYILDTSDFAAPNTIDETSNFSGRSKLLNYLGQNSKLKQYL